VPYPIAFLRDRPDTRPTTSDAAVTRNRQAVRRIADDWVRRFPTSADALETLAWAQETTGDLGTPNDDQRGALAAVRRARRAATSPTQQLRLAADETRLLLKLEEYGGARHLADSLLGANLSPTAEDAALLAGLAALTGRTARTADLLSRSVAGAPFHGLWGQVVPLPSAVVAAGQSMLAYAALGGPADSLTAWERRVTRLVSDSVRPDRRPEALEALLIGPAILAYPVVGARPIHATPRSPNYLLELQARVARGDTTGARAFLAQLVASRRGVRPTAIGVDGTYQEAWLRLQLRDTAAARAQLDSTLNTLHALGVYVLDRVPEASALVRAMALRADLAAASGDRTAAQWWGQRVVLLWSDADRGLQPTVSRMRVLAGN
jgi:hypothetical protein